jgi:hypothetical protein
MMRNLKKRASCHEDRFPKTLFTLSRCRIAEDGLETFSLDRRCTSMNEVK